MNPSGEWQAASAEENFTHHVGTKFNKDGSVRSFPGNTVVAMVPPESAQHSLITRAQEMLSAMQCASCFAMLPPASFHMTVIEGVCDQVRTADKWPADLELDTPLDEVRAFFIDRLSGIEHPQSFAMKLEMFDVVYGGVIKLNLVPADDATATSLRRYRDEYAAATGLKFTDHDTYGFHTTLAYKLHHLAERQAEELEPTRAQIEGMLLSELGILTTGPARLCWFPDMFSFPPEEN